MEPKHGKPDNYEIIPRQPEQLAYVAGLFDGEGCICVFPTNYQPKTGVNFGASRYSIHVCVRMCNEQVIRWLCEQFQGRFAYINRKKDNSKWTDAYDFVLKEVQAVAFLRAISPYMRVKKEQAALLFKFFEVKKQARYKADSHRAELMDDLYVRIKAFNRASPSGKRRLKKNRGAVETERFAPADSGMKFQSGPTSDSGKAELVMAQAVQQSATKKPPSSTSSPRVKSRTISSRAGRLLSPFTSLGTRA